MDEISSMKKFELIRISGWIASGNSEHMFQKCSFLSIGSFSDNFESPPVWTHPTSRVRSWTRYETSISAVEKLYQSYTCHVFIGYFRLNYFQVYFLHRMLSVCDVRVTLLSAAHFKLLLHQEGENDLLLHCFCDMLIVTFFLFLSKFAVCGALSFSLSVCLSVSLSVCLYVSL